MENKTIMVMCPTYRRAVYEWEKFLKVFPNAWTNVKRNHLSMTNVITGTTYIFHSETEGQRILKGFHGDVVSIDEFELYEENRMGGKWSICARNLKDDAWIIADYNCDLFQFIFKGIYCLIKYDVVDLGKHGRG